MMVRPQGYQMPPHAPLARDAVRYVEQPVAAVIAQHRYGARDATELVLVDYEPLPAVVDPERALETSSSSPPRSRPGRTKGERGETTTRCRSWWHDTR